MPLPCLPTADRKRLRDPGTVHLRITYSIVGRHTAYARTSDEDERSAHTFHFCPDCGATVFYTNSEAPDVVAVPVGAFADPAFPPPTVSVYESRRHPWLAVNAPLERID